MSFHPTFARGKQACCCILHVNTSCLSSVITLFFVKMRKAILVFVSLLCLCTGQPSKRLISYRASLFASSGCFANSCDGTFQAEVEQNKPSTGMTSSSCALPDQVSWSETTPGVINHALSLDWLGELHNMAGSGAPGEWHNLEPPLTDFFDTCAFSISFSAYVRENEIFPTGQTSSTHKPVLK